VSGKDLVPNHLTFFLYNHAAFFPKDLCPKGVRANGHLLLNDDKMSKSTGNFLTLAGGLGKFSADGMRFALADAGDSLDDANFKDETAVAAILRLYSQFEWIRDTLKTIDTLRNDEPHTFFDLVFASQINFAIKETDENFDRMKFKLGLRTGFHDLQRARDDYRLGEKSMNARLIRRFIEVQTVLLSPICPHFCDYVWTRLLGNKDSVRNARWPECGTIDGMLLQRNAYLQENLHAFRTRAEAMAPGYVDTSVGHIYVSDVWPQWHQTGVTALKKLYRPETNDFPDDYKRQVADLLKGDKSITKETNKKIMTLVALMPERVKAEGPSALELTIPFDQREVLARDGFELIREGLGLTTLHVHSSSDQSAPDIEGKKSQAVPGKPIFTFAGEKKVVAKQPKKPAGAAASGSGSGNAKGGGGGGGGGGKGKGGAPGGGKAKAKPQPKEKPKTEGQ